MTRRTNAAPGATGTASKKSVGSLTFPIIRGCPCGCMTSATFNDPDCARNRPVSAPPQWGGYDAADLGLVPHPRDTCDACMAVGK